MPQKKTSAKTVPATSKSDFISIATHQLKTPLVGNKWALSFILSGNVGALSPAQNDLLEKIYDSNERAIKLIDDMLRADREEAAVFDMHPSQVFLPELLEKVIREVTPDAAKKSIRLEFIKGEGSIPKITADAEKLNYVFENLLNNAVNYTEQGGSVSISIEDGNGGVTVSVTDTGIGIPAADQINIFRKFFRATNSRKVANKGTGLGLFITKRIIEEHGGTVWFKSEENRGTAFYVALPVKKVV